MFGPQMCVLYMLQFRQKYSAPTTNHHQTSFLNAQPTKLRSKTVGTKSNPQTERNGGQPCSVCVYNIVYHILQIVLYLYNSFLYRVSIMWRVLHATRNPVFYVFLKTHQSHTCGALYVRYVRIEYIYVLIVIQYTLHLKQASGYISFNPNKRGIGEKSQTFDQNDFTP